MDGISGIFEKMNYIKKFAIISLLLPAAVFPQRAAEPGNRSPLAAADEHLSAAFAEGHYTGTFWIMNQWGQKESFVFHLFLRDKDRFWRILSERKGNQIRILTKGASLEIHADDLRISEKFFMKSEDRFRRVMGSGFQFWDLGGFPLSELFRESGQKGAVLSGKQVTSTELVPRLPGITEAAVLFSDPEKNNRPLRIDYYRKNRVLYRTVSFHYSDSLKTYEGSGLEGKQFPLRTEVTDLDASEVSGIETEMYDSSRPPAPLFNAKNI